MSERIKGDKIIELLRSGWELGYSNSSRGAYGNYWMQPRLCCGGESKDVHASTVDSLLRKNIIKHSNRRDDDPFWLQRFELIAPPAKEKGNEHQD